MQQPISDATVVVAGGTGNVGGFIVQQLLERGATVAVPSRSEDKQRELRDFLADRVEPTDLQRLRTITGDVGDPDSADDVRARIENEVGPPDAVIVSLGRFVAVPSLLTATVEQLRQAVDGYLVGHFVAARTFLPNLRRRGGTYLFVNGPLAFDPWEGSGAGLVSTVTAAQHMLFRSLAQEVEDDAVRVVELVSHAFIRERQTQPGSPVGGEDVGAYAAQLLGEERDRIHGRSLHLESKIGEARAEA